MTLETSVGESFLSVGVSGPIRQGKNGQLITADAHGKLYELTANRRLFQSYGAAQTLTAVNTTYTGHLLHNPVGSGVNLVLYEVDLVVSVTSASLTGIALASAAQATTPTGTTAIERQGNLNLGGAAGAVLAYKAATLTAAGTSFRILTGNTAAIATTGITRINVDLAGSVIVPPGYWVALAALGAASAASAVGSSIIYAEIPE